MSAWNNGFHAWLLKCLSSRSTSLEAPLWTHTYLPCLADFLSHLLPCLDPGVLWYFVPLVWPPVLTFWSLACLPAWHRPVFMVFISCTPLLSQITFFSESPKSPGHRRLNAVLKMLGASARHGIAAHKAQCGWPNTYLVLSRLDVHSRRGCPLSSLLYSAGNWFSHSGHVNSSNNSRNSCTFVSFLFHLH